MELPIELIEAARNNNLVIFVGAGLSCTFTNAQGKTLGNWKNLVKQIVESSSKEGYFTTLLQSAIDRGDEPIEVLDLIEILSLLPKDEIAGFANNFYSLRDNDSWLRDNLPKMSKILPKDKIVEFVKDFYSLSDTNDWRLHEKLYELSSIIITTNYDNAFEHAKQPLKTILFGRDNRLQILNNPQESILFKLHGCITAPETLVIFPYDYAFLYEHRAHAIIADFKKLIINKCILFIGCGMDDWQINTIFLNVKKMLADIQQKHFIITKKKEFEDKEKKLSGFLTPVFIEKYRQSDDPLEERNIDNIIDCLLKEKSTTTNSNAKYDSYNRANELFVSAMSDDNESLLNEYCKEYQKAALSLNSRSEEGFYKWGTALLQLAILQKSEKLYKESIEKFRIARELNPNREESAKNLQYAHHALMQLNIEEILNEYQEKQQDTNNSQKNTRMIPVKGCLCEYKGSLCGYINSCESTTCKQCGNPLGKEWSDDGHVSAGVCEKCGKYVGIMGNACPKCGDEVPYHYEDFFNGRIKNAWKNFR
jgi:hypothetical protein